MPNIKLLDVNTKTIYTLEVSEEDATKANQDRLFATELLQNHLNKDHDDNFSEDDTKSVKSTKSIEKSAPSPISSTSSTYVEASIDKKQKTRNSSSEKNNFVDGYRWSHDAILALFDIYKEEEHIISTGISMKKFWNIVSAKLNERGFYVNDTQCKSKMAGLRITYKNIKDYNKKHVYSHRRWRYFEIMDDMYKKNPWISTIYKAIKSKNTSIQSTRSLRSTRSANPRYIDDDEDIANNENNEDNTDNDLDNMDNAGNPSSLPKPESSKRVTQIERIISVVEENTIERKRMHKEAMKRQDKLLDILEKMYSSVNDRDEVLSNEPSPNQVQSPTKRSNKFSTTEKLITAIEESNSKRSRMHEDVMTRQDKLLNILEKMFEK